MLAIRPVQHEEVSISACLGKQLTRLSINLAVNQNRRFICIPIVYIVGRNLVIPGQLSGIGIDCHNGAGVKVIALPALFRQHRIRIASAEVVKVEFRVVRAGHPSLPRAMGRGSFIRPCLNAGLTFARRCPPFPLQGSRFRISRLEKSRVI